VSLPTCGQSIAFQEKAKERVPRNSLCAGIFIRKEKDGMKKISRIFLFGA